MLLRLSVPLPSNGLSSRRGEERCSVGSQRQSEKVEWQAVWGSIGGRLLSQSCMKSRGTSTREEATSQPWLGESQARQEDARVPRHVMAGRGLHCVSSRSIQA